MTLQRTSFLATTETKLVVQLALVHLRRLIITVIEAIRLSSRSLARSTGNQEFAGHHSYVGGGYEGPLSNALGGGQQPD